MLLWLCACWKNISQVIPHEEAQKWSERVVVESQHDILQIDVRAGSAQDPIGKEGLAYLVAHSIFPKELHTEIVVGREHVRFRLPIPKSQEEQIINTILDSMINPMWAAERLEDRKDGIKEDMHVWRIKDSFLRDLLAQRMYAGHPYGHLLFGGATSLDSIRNMDVHTFYAQNYVRSGVSLGWDGKAYRRSILEEMYQGLSRLPMHTPKYATPVSLSIQKEAQLTYLNVPNYEGISAGWGVLAPQASNEQRMAMLVLQEYMCPFEEIDRRESIFSVYDPAVLCSFTANSQEELMGELERLDILFHTFKELDEQVLLQLKANGENNLNKDRFALLAQQRLFPNFFTDIEDVTSIRTAIKFLDEQEPKILVISAYSLDDIQDIEDFLDIPVYVMESSLDTFTQ